MFMVNSEARESLPGLFHLREQVTNVSVGFALFSDRLTYDLVSSPRSSEVCCVGDRLWANSHHGGSAARF